MSYLGDLTKRLTAGAMRLPEELRNRHAAYLAAAQNEDGGFAGRQGPSDLYYSSIALRGLALMGKLERPAAARAAEFLKTQLQRKLAGIDFFSLTFSALLLEATYELDVLGEAGCDRAAVVAAGVDRFRHGDGGYAKTKRGRQSSTYHTFLAVACKQLVGAASDRTEQLIEMVRSRHRPDGGFVEIAQMRQSATNPTSAAVGVLRVLDAMDETTRHGAVRFLSEMQNAEGGFRANTRVPVADLLSTFTALVSMAELDGLGMVDLAAAGGYAESLQWPEGGFRGGAWDETADVEYTFYGLGTMALLATMGE